MSLLTKVAAAAEIAIRKNSGSVIGTRGQINLIEGVGVDILVEDDPAEEEITVTPSTTTPTQQIVLLPDDAALPTVNPAILASHDEDTNFADESLDFPADGANDKIACWEQFLSPDYDDENIVADIYWVTIDADTGHNAEFGFSVLGRAPGEAWSAAMGAEQTVITANGGNGVLNKTRVTTFDPLWDASDVLLFKLVRKSSGGNDTVDEDIRVVKVVVSYTQSFPQSFYPLGTPVELSIGAVAGWREVDCSSYIPAGATGVILHVTTLTATANNFGLRKKGSTDARTDGATYTHFGAMVGVDENLKFECYHGYADCKVFLTGYTGEGVVFFDNAYDKTPAIATWGDMDCATECPNAIGLIFETVTIHTRYMGLRVNGSGDDRGGLGGYPPHAWGVVGCDGSQVCEGYDGSMGQSYYLIGYITKGASFPLNRIGKSLGVTDSWEEIDCHIEAPKAIFLFFLVMNSDGNLRHYGLRKNGSDEDYYDDYSYNKNLWAFVRCDAGQKVQGKIENVDQDFLLVGYATHAG